MLLQLQLVRVPLLEEGFVVEVKLQVWVIMLLISMIIKAIAVGHFCVPLLNIQHTYIFLQFMLLLLDWYSFMLVGVI